MDAKEARFPTHATLKFVLSAQPASRDGWRGERRNKQSFPGMLKSFCPRNQPAGTGKGGRGETNKVFQACSKAIFRATSQQGRGGGGEAKQTRFSRHALKLFSAQPASRDAEGGGGETIKVFQACSKAFVRATSQQGWG